MNIGFYELAPEGRRGLCMARMGEVGVCCVTLCLCSCTLVFYASMCCCDVKCVVLGCLCCFCSLVFYASMCCSDVKCVVLSCVCVLVHWFPMLLCVLVP